MRIKNTHLNVAKSKLKYARLKQNKILRVLNININIKL